MPEGFGKTLAIGHALVGIAALLSPMRTADTFGVRPARSTVFITRLFGSRDLVLAWAITSTLAGSAEHKLALLAANAINLIDAISGVVTYLHKDLSDKGLILGTGGALGLFALGFASLKRQHLI